LADRGLSAQDLNSRVLRQSADLQQTLVYLAALGEPKPVTANAPLSAPTLLAVEF
jgi:hypothetical protein